MVNETLKNKTTSIKIRKKSIWFWLFWALLIGLITTASVSFYEASRPVKLTDSASKITKSDTTFDVSMNKKQINALTAHYLNETDNGGYTFKVDKQIMMYGSAKFLGQKFNFGMALDPELTTNGNIILKAKSLAIGNLPLPIKTVMKFIRSSYKAPKYVTIVPNKKEIFIDMSKLPTIQGMRFQAKEINMDEDKFVFKISLVV
ncbi:MAG: YpmS family protein [Lactobacillaceae bacterium]|jgi:uncharacterized protein YpmS|nr:YpmS family protein [Lactobacillaceae bacterium]